MIRKATFKEFKQNDRLIIKYGTFGSYPVHYEWLAEMQVYAIVSDRDNNLMFPPHYCNLKELYKAHIILIEERNLLEDVD